MNTIVSAPLLTYTLVCIALLGVTHVLFARRGLLKRRFGSPQTILAKLILFLNAPVLVGAGVIAWIESRAFSEAISMLIFSGIVFNGAAYAYFHVFNMSETARRIRILVHVLVYKSVNASDLRNDYLPRDMVVTRLYRLVQMKQITISSDGSYRIGGRLLLFAARVIRVWRRVLQFERHRPAQG